MMDRLASTLDTICNAQVCVCGGGGTLIFFSIHIGLADLFGFKSLNFNIFVCFFFENISIFGVEIFMGSLLNWIVFMGYFFKLSGPVCVL